MFERYLSKSVQYDESVIRLVRPSWLHYRWPFAGLSILLICGLFFLYPLQSFGRWGWVIAAAIVGISVIGLLRIWLMRSLTAFIVTNRRILDIDQKKLFERHVSECALDSIRDIRYNTKGVVSMLGNIGTLVIETGGEHGHIECQDVHDPESVKELLTRVQHHNKK